MQYRYKKMPTIPSGGKELVDFVRLERRKELCYEGHRKGGETMRVKVWSV